MILTENANIFLYYVNQLVLIIGTRIVLCEVRIRFLSEIYIKCGPIYVILKISISN